MLISHQSEVKCEKSVTFKCLANVFIGAVIVLDSVNDGADKFHVKAEALLLLIVVEIFVLANLNLSQVNFTAHIMPRLLLFEHRVCHSGYVTWLL